MKSHASSLLGKLDARQRSRFGLARLLDHDHRAVGDLHAGKSYRDDQLGGIIRFWTALRLGLGITLVAGVVYVIGWEIYFQTVGGDFLDQYIASSVEQLGEEGADAAELTRARQDMEAFSALYDNLAARMAITLLEIFPVGAVIALLSAALLRKT